MGDYHYRLPIHIPQGEEQPVKLRLGPAVEIAGRFIRIQHGRVVDKRPCYGYPLLLAAGELGWLVPRPFSKPEVTEKPESGGFSSDVNSGRR